MKKPTLKTSISLFSLIAMTLILLGFTLFIYSYLATWLLHREQASVLTQAKQVAGSYPSHLQEGAGQDSSQWLIADLTQSQRVDILTLHGKKVLSQGHLPSIIGTHNEKVLQQGATYIRLGGHSYVRGIMPVVNESGQQTNWVVVTSSVDTLFGYLDTLITVLLIGGLGAIVLSGLSGYLVAWTALRPFERIIRAIKNIDSNRLSDRLQKSNDSPEIMELVDSFNTMLERIENTMVLQNRFVEDASHELRSPLTVIEGYVNLLDRWGKTDPVVMERALTAIKKESTRLRQLTNDLLELSSLYAITSEPPMISVDEVLNEVVTNMQVAYGRTIDYHRTQAVTLPMHVHHLQQLFMIFFDNAIKHTTPEQKIFLRSSADERSVTIAVEDHGQGIAQEDLNHIFDRFYRADTSRNRKQGAGLGLAIAKQIVELYSGAIHITSQPGHGTKVVVTLPRR